MGRLSANERIQNNIVVNPTTACWLWTSTLSRDGYAKIHFGGKKISAHRLAFTIYTGQNIEGLQLDHLCRVRNCVNPAHLRPCNARSNIFAPGSLCIAKRLAEQTHCKNGHQFDEVNTYYRKSNPSYRFCRKCNAERGTARYRRLKKEKQ